MSKEENLAKVTKDLLLSNPFYGIFLTMLNKRWDKGIPTAGVGKNGIGYQLYINEDFWNKLENDNQREFLLGHEIRHIAFGHCTEFGYMNVRDIANIAMDLEIHCWMSYEHMPAGGQKIELYPELKLEPKKGSDYYYQALLKASRDNSCPNLTAQLKAMGQGQIKVTVSVNGKDYEVTLDKHGSWEEFDKLSDAEKKLIQKQVEHILSEVADQVVKSRGTIPGEFAEIIKRIQNPEPPKFDWKGYLRNFIGGSTKTYVKKTRRKQSKRFEDSPGQRVLTQKHVLLMVDTSGLN